jgi:2-methylcitrate dehydratase
VEFDTTITQIAKFVTSTCYDTVPTEARQKLVWHLLDSVGCALGGLDGAPCRAVRAIAASGACDEGAASVIGLERRTTLEYAAFANSCMIRYLDFNDSYLTNGGGHTSDLIPAILAVAEQRGSSGRDVIVALHVAYEVFAALADTVPMRDRGWDYPAFLEIAAAAGVANVMGLDAEQTGNAVSMAITPNLPLGVTRAGHLSNWKGLASPYGTMAAVFAARLAQAGMTGPPRAIEGVRGLWALATGPFSLASLGQPVGGLTAVERSSFKLYVAEFNAQGPVHEFVQLHHQSIRPDDVESIHIGTYEVAWSEIGGGQDDHDQKWDPQNKETADHSLPYMVAVALTDGACTEQSYTTERVRDPGLRPLMEKVTVVPDEVISKTWVENPAHEIEVVLRDGATIHLRSDYPRGHPRNPMTEDELFAKFRTQSRTRLDDADTEDLLGVLLRTEDLADVDDLTSWFRRIS